MISTPLFERKNQASFQYDFTKLGGAVGNILLKGDDLPLNALVTKVWIYTSVAVTSAGAATIALQMQSAGDLLAATGKASFSLNSVQDGIPMNTAATAVRATSDISYLTMVVGTAALTAGKIDVIIEYVRI